MISDLNRDLLLEYTSIYRAIIISLLSECTSILGATTLLLEYTSTTQPYPWGFAVQN
jgi:hypothetical protein